MSIVGALEKSPAAPFHASLHDDHPALPHTMNSSFRWFLLFVTCLVAPSTPAANREGLKLPETFDVKAIDAFLAAQVRQADRVGFSVAVVKDGQVVLAKSYGKRSLADGRPVETDTLFAIGSVSKQFTCAAVLLLAEA